MRIQLLCVVVLMRSLVAGAAPESKTLPVSAGRNLVYAALPDETRKLPGLGVVPGRVENGRCLTFDVLWSNPGIGSAHVDFYTIDLKTGTLWRGVTGVLELVSTPAVIRLQRHLRKSAGIGEAESRDAAEKHSCGY